MCETVIKESLEPMAKSYYRGPRIIATDRQAHRIYPQMIRLCSRFDSVLFTPKMSESPSYGNYSRSPIVSCLIMQPMKCGRIAVEASGCTCSPDAGQRVLV